MYSYSVASVWACVRGGDNTCTSVWACVRGGWRDNTCRAIV